MPAAISPREFVAKWRQSTLKESAGKHEYFIDICRLVGHPTPVEGDPKGVAFGFEKDTEKLEGGLGFADFWKKGFFGWEGKGRHGSLKDAYRQLLQYRESLGNPPLLVVSDFERIQIHTNFTNSVQKVVTLTLDDLLTPQGVDNLCSVFSNPDAFKSDITPDQVTQDAARKFGRLADLLRKWGVAPQPAAHFLIRILFCLFAEDVGLLPNRLFSRIVTKTRMRPVDLARQMKDLFRSMATGGWFGEHEIPYFDGRLFDDDTALELDSDALSILAEASELDWSSIEPSILGTLFERGLDPSKRSQIGAHFTSKEDMLLIVEPVLMAPLRGRWAEVESEGRAIAGQRDGLESSQTAERTQLTDKIRDLLLSFDAELAAVRVLDPACGSGNFLYVSLRQLLDLEKFVIVLAGELGVGPLSPNVTPAQLHGIEINPYAHELAQTTVWIGYIQWLRENGFGTPTTSPILKPLDNIAAADAILKHDERGNPIEPEWPPADCIVGNPPFLGGKLLRSNLGDKYVDDVFALYDGRVSREADLVCYWFEKARAMVKAGKVKRVGLLATQGIRGGANRKVLERIKKSGDIFMAWSDRPWILDGAAVHVSMVGFDNGNEQLRTLNGQPAEAVHTDLTGALDLTIAKPLAENMNIAFMGDTKVGPFDIDAKVARAMLAATGNPNGNPNSDVVRPWVNGLDVTRRPRNMWIVDFGTDTPQERAAQYEAPFEYIREHVKPFRRDAKSGDRTGVAWWLHQRPRPDMRCAIASILRYIGTACTAKHRIFVWLSKEVLPDHQLIVFARDDDYFFGVLHSKLHELWARRKGTQLREAESGFRYTPTTTFETFPFPWPPGQEPKNDPRVQAIAQAASELVEQRDRWLNPPDASEPELKKRTLTNLYNQSPMWLELVHRRLDEAVVDAYGWPHGLSDETTLERLLELNRSRAAGEAPSPETDDG